MEKQIIVTSDGSHSISIPQLGVTYHSTHGAIQESMHVFIEAGLRSIAGARICISVLEIGFGTGLNALLSLAEAEKNRQMIYYETIEPHPLEANIFTLLNYCNALQRPDLLPVFMLLHECSWNEIITISPYFTFKKNRVALADFETNRSFQLIYFDAFAPETQPGLWTAAIFTKIYGLMETNGVLTTYCSKSIVRKAMTEAGLRVEKIPGPPHKREMVRALKP